MKLDGIDFDIIRGMSRAHSLGGLYLDASLIAGFVESIEVDSEKDRELIVYQTDRLAQYGAILSRRQDGSDTFEYRLRESTTALRHGLPNCSFCVVKVEAVADIRCGARGGQWAFVCVEHFDTEDGHLGLGMGQVLVNTKRD